MTYSADALVLKYAQKLYGLDAKAVAATGLDASRLPGVSGYRVISAPRGIAADMLLLVGVVPLRGFRYSEIRDFGRRALCSVASERPDARVVAVTLHGAGYGLDEIEAFDSELAGILDALRDGNIPPALERVVIVEANRGRAARLKSRLKELLPDEIVVAGAKISDTLEHRPAQRFRTVGYDSSRRDHAFVAMPFSGDFEDLFHYGISAAVRAAGLLCERIDQQAFTGDVVERLKKQIETARVVVADLSTSSPNVFLEVGYAWGRDVPTVLLSRKNRNSNSTCKDSGAFCTPVFAKPRNS